MQTLAHRSCARSLGRAACAALLVIALSSFAVPGATVSAIVPEGAWFRRAAPYTATPPLRPRKLVALPTTTIVPRLRSSI